MSAIDPTTLLDRFAASRTVTELEDCASALLKEKLVNKVRGDERFRLGLANCFHVKETAADQLKAIAIAYRLGETSKPVMQFIKPLSLTGPGKTGPAAV